MSRFRQSGLASFGHAFRGLARLLARQPHARVHAAAACAAVAAGLLLDISRGEWVAVALSIGLVFAAEALNSAIEELADALHPDEHPGIGRAKDLAAAGVLLAAAAAAIVGLIVFLPRLLKLG
jgi:diacylglycerol kinase (ATP)